MYIIHLKPDQPEALSVRIDEWGGGATKRALIMANLTNQRQYLMVSLIN